MKHLFISDVQAKPGVDLQHLSWLGQYIIYKQPDVIVNIGDFADMESLSSYDKGTKSFEGRRYKRDIQAATIAMDLLLGPLRKLQEKQRAQKSKVYKPRMVMCLGNHEQRISRAVENQPELDGVIGYHDLPYEDWEVHDFLKPVMIDGVIYVHFLANPMTGKPMTGTALNQLIKVGQSFVCGHKQVLDVATRFTLDGRQQWGIISGAFYSHNESYKGYQGNDHWRGIVMLNDVKDGSFSPFFVSLDYLKSRYGQESSTDSDGVIR